MFSIIFDRRPLGRSGLDFHRLSSRRHDIREAKIRKLGTEAEDTRFTCLKFLRMTSGVRFLGPLGRRPDENAFSQKIRSYVDAVDTRAQLNKYARFCGFHASKSPGLAACVPLYVFIDRPSKSEIASDKRNEGCYEFITQTLHWRVSTESLENLLINHMYLSLEKFFVTRIKHGVDSSKYTRRVFDPIFSSMVVSFTRDILSSVDLCRSRIRTIFALRRLKSSKMVENFSRIPPSSTYGFYLVSEAFTFIS